MTMSIGLRDQFWCQTSQPNMVLNYHTQPKYTSYCTCTASINRDEGSSRTLCYKKQRNIVLQSIWLASLRSRKVEAEYHRSFGWRLVSFYRCWTSLENAILPQFVEVCKKIPEKRFCNVLYLVLDHTSSEDTTSRGIYNFYFQIKCFSPVQTLSLWKGRFHWKGVICVLTCKDAIRVRARFDSLH